MGLGGVCFTTFVRGYAHGGPFLNFLGEPLVVPVF